MFLVVLSKCPSLAVIASLELLSRNPNSTWNQSMLLISQTVFILPLMNAMFILSVPLNPSFNVLLLLFSVRILFLLPRKFPNSSIFYPNQPLVYHSAHSACPARKPSVIAARPDETVQICERPMYPKWKVATQ